MMARRKLSAATYLINLEIATINIAPSLLLLVADFVEDCGLTLAFFNGKHAELKPKLSTKFKESMH